MPSVFLPLSAPTLVNTTTAHDQGRPVSVTLGNGGYMTAWVSETASGEDLMAQRFDDLGNPVGSEFRINSYEPGDQQNLTMIELANGSVLAVWESYLQDGSRFGVYAQRFNANGDPLGGEFQVSDASAGNQYRPDAIALDGGGFAIGWLDPNTDRYYAANGTLLNEYHTDPIHIQLYDASGAEVGGETRLGEMYRFPQLSANIYTSVEYGQSFGTMVPVSGGGFGVFYQSYPEVDYGSGPQRGSSEQYYQLFDSAGVEIGGPAPMSIDMYAADVVTKELADGTIAILSGYNSTGSGSWQDSYGIFIFDPATLALSGPIYSIDRGAGTFGPWMNDFLIYSSYDPRVQIEQLQDGTILLVYFSGDFNDVTDSSGIVIDRTYTFNITGVQIDPATGAELNPPFVIGHYDAADYPSNLDVVALASGGAAISWERYTADDPDSRGVEQVTLLGLVSGSTNDDILDGTSATDWLDGLSGNDVINGLTGDDLLEGNIGLDTLNGGRGNDRLDGGDDADLLNGGRDNDWHYGMGGNDILWTNPGDDTFDGGEGTDTLVLRTAQFVSLAGSGVDRGDGADHFVSIENVQGSSGDDRIVGDAQANVLMGAKGNDRLQGREGDDTLEGGQGNDTLSGAQGRDTYVGGAGNDVFVFSNETDFEGRLAVEWIADFTRGQDVIDVSGLGVSFLGTSAFSGTAGEMRYYAASGRCMVQFDFDGDGVADGTIRVNGQTTMIADDFVL